jgi:di/tricarboxylate transporter
MPLLSPPAYQRSGVKNRLASAIISFFANESGLTVFFAGIATALSVEPMNNGISLVLVALEYE